MMTTDNILIDKPQKVIQCDFKECALYYRGFCISTNETKCKEIPPQFKN